MRRVFLFHWRPEESGALVAALQGTGFEVEHHRREGGSPLTALRRSMPDSVVIDLSRLPSQGREAATGIRASKSLRHIPIVFADGLPEKVAAVRAMLPDAVYTTTEHVGAAVKDALAAPPASPVVPEVSYPDRPVAAKLGIKEGSVVAAVEPPAGFPRLLGPLPSGVEFDETGTVTLWFVRDADDLRAAVPTMRRLAAASKLWILWPKQPKGRALNQNFVRETGLAAGLVDYKICSVNETWSAIAFAVAGGRKAAKSAT